MTVPQPKRAAAADRMLRDVATKLEAQERRRRRVLLPWRAALLAYAVALTTATHWPRLRLGPEVPTSDKVLHLLAFGVLTLLIWRSGWFGPRWLVTMIAVAWAALDEVSQGIPVLHRTVSVHDLVANICGVVCTMALIWAMAPLQSDEQLAGPDRARARLFAFTFDELFTGWRPWLIGAGAAALCAVVIALARPFLPSPRSVGVFGVLSVVIALHALYLVYRRMFFRDLHRVQRQRPCLECGTSETCDQGRDAHECPACGALRLASAYEMAPRPSLAALVRIGIFPAVVAVAGVGALFALVLLLPLTYGWGITTSTGGRLAPRLAQFIGRAPPGLSTAVDLTVYMLLIAVVVRLWRRRFAAYIDRAVRCRACGHDLHGTPVNERGEGHCGECGASFLRA